MDQELCCVNCGSEFVETAGQDVASFLSSSNRQNLPDLNRRALPTNTDPVVNGIVNQILGVGDNPLMAILQHAIGGSGNGGAVGLVMRPGTTTDMTLPLFGGQLHARGGSNQPTHGIGNSFEDLLHHLMMTEPSSRGAPPASPEVIERLERRRDNLHELGECSISQEAFAENDVALILPCGHAFREELIVHWLQSHDTCPVCRISISDIN